MALRPGRPEVAAEEALSRRLAAGAFLLDVRFPCEFSAGHVPGAVLIPLYELERRMDELPRDREILVICRTGHRSAEAVELLRAGGFRAVNVADGMVGWRGEVRGWTHPYACPALEEVGG